MEKAIERLEKYVEVDRKLRDGKAESDYEQFCEEICEAIETLIEEVQK